MTDIFDGVLDAPGQLATATVTAIGADTATVTLADGRGGVLPRTEFPRNHRWAVGQRLVVELLSDGPRPLVSTVRPTTVRLVLASYVPELRDGTVRIMAVAREAGSRTKVAVAPTVEGVDAVGAVLGRASNRIKAAAVDLGGERIDVVAWNPDVSVFIRNALGPVGVTDVTADDTQITVTVPPHLTEAARGGGSLNVRLVAGLVGRRVIIAAGN